MRSTDLKPPPPLWRSPLAWIIAIIAAVIAMLTAGCTPLFETTARQRNTITVSETRDSGAATITTGERTVTYYDEAGVPQHSVTEPVYAVAPPTSKTVTINSDSEDAILGLKSMTDAQGSSYGIDHTGEGNAETLGLTTNAQIQRTQISAELVANVAAATAKGVVEGLAPYLIFKEGEKTKRSADDNATKVRLGEIEAAKPEGGHEE